MKYEEIGWFSQRLSRWMNIKIYGHYGPAIIVFPCQDKASDDFYLHGMIDTLSSYIEEGKFKLFCLDSNDSETVSSPSWDNEHKAYLVEEYHQYVINEVLPFVYEKQNGRCLPYLIGCSMGGTYASINFLRRPELFSGFLSLSGSFNLSEFFLGYMNSNIYNNSPIHFLNNMDRNHPYIRIYNKKKMMVICGTGNFEFLVLDSNYELKRICQDKNINIDFQLLGQEFTHDWPSWKYLLYENINKLIS